MNVFAVELLDSASTSVSSSRCAEMLDDDDTQLMMPHDVAVAESSRRSSTGLLSPHRRVFLASALAAVGGILFGYDLGIYAAFTKWL